MKLLGKNVCAVIFTVGLTCGSLLFVTGDAAAGNPPALQAELAKARAMMAELRQQAAQLQQKMQELQAERDKQFQRVAELTDRLQRMVNEVKQLQAENARLLARVRRPPRYASRYATLPSREGLVTAVVKPGTVEISLGSDDGVLKGHFLQVYRVYSNARAYVGRIEVVKSESDKSVCRIDPAYGRGNVIHKGDRVTTAPRAPQPGELPRLVDGEVLSVGKEGEVEVSFGADHGLWPGHRLEVYRLSGETGVYVSRIEVVKTMPKKSICKSIIEFEKHTIQKGDRVTSKL